MAQVIIVSNRLPVSVAKENGELVFSRTVGGLATGLSSYTDDGKSQWIGWPGIASDGLSDTDKQAIVAELAKQNFVPVFLNQRQLDGYYNGYSNTVLWPLMHNTPYKKRPDHEQWRKAYREVNKIFAEAILSLARPKSTIWVHDYLLLLLPEMLRAQDSGGQIGFFLHIPFPSPQKFGKLAEARQLVTGMLGADLVGFHTTSYSDNFMLTCLELGAGIPTDKQIILPNRTVQVTNFPIGVDYEKFARAGRLRPVKQAVKRYKEKYGRRRIIVAIDRVEPAKGLVERLKAYRDFLAANPALHNKVIMVMVAAPSRMALNNYQQLQKRLQKLTDEINAEYGSVTWQPVDFINESLPFEEVSALYRIADVAFIAPLRDGMNLVAKEYVASKRRNGVLILSETAGAAEELRDALLVNPLRKGSSAAALQQAFTMPKRELRRRLRSMQRELTENTIHTWAGGFVKTLQTPIPGTPSLLVRTVRGKTEMRLLDDYRTAPKRLLLLDYDGSLVSFSENFADAKPPKRLLDLLEKLTADERNEVVLVSGRSANDLSLWFGSLPISLIAEHGALIKKTGAKSWQSYEKSETAWKRVFQPVLEKYARLTPGARVEIKPHSLAWHYRSSPPFYAQKYAVTIKQVLRPFLKKYGLQLMQGNKVIELKDPRISKGVAVQPWLRRNYDFILAIGDDLTDENLFSALPLTAYTIKVGRGTTIARFRLPSPAEVQKLLRKLAN